MKKRIFLIVASILCAVVSFSQIVYTIAISLKDTTTTPNNGSNVNVNLGNTEYGDPVDVSLGYLLGDIVDDEILNTCYSQVGSSVILTYDQNLKAFVATKVGVESYNIVSGGKLYHYTVEVLDAGNGTKENPFVIVNAEDFVELVARNNNPNVYYSQKADLDLSEYGSWVPVGTMSAPFAANYNGNGYAIKNMSIVINESNIADYISVSGSSNVYLVGFFGCINGQTKVTTIENVNIENAFIDSTAIDNSTAIRSRYNFLHAYTGVLAGMALNCEIVGNGNSVVESTVNSSMSNNDSDAANGAVTGMVGLAMYSTISGYDVNIVVKSNGLGFVDSNLVGYGHRIAGVVGTLYDSVIKECNVDANVDTTNRLDTIVAGVAYFVDGDSKIENVNVKSFVVNVTRVLFSDSILVRISGVADQLGETCEVNNSHILYANVEAVGTGQIAGLVNINHGKIVNSSVQTDNSQFHEPGLKGTISAGLVYINNGRIEFNEYFNKLYAVDVALRAQIYAGGFVVYNFGDIIGDLDLTEMKAQIYWLPLNGSYFLKSGESIDSKYMLAGIACVNAGGSIMNFTTIVKMYDAVNAAGAVGFAGDYVHPMSGKTYSGGLLKNLYVNSTVRTLANFEGKTYSEKTNVVAGLIGFVNGSGTVRLDDVCGHMDVNYKSEINPNGRYSLKCYGSIVGVLNGKVAVSVTANSNKNFFIDSVYSNNGSKSSLVKSQVGNTKSGNITIPTGYLVITDIELV